MASTLMASTLPPCKLELFSRMAPHILATKESYNFAHEAPVIMNNYLYFTSNRIYQDSESQTIHLNRMSLFSNKVEYNINTDIPMPNGAFAIPQKNTIVIAAQGNKSHHAGLYLYNTETQSTRPILTYWSGNQSFNSPNDIIVHGNFIYFSDPSYGFEQGFRPEPGVGNWVWRAEFQNQEFIDLVDVRPVIDDLVKPNGLSFSPDYKFLYVTDSGYFSGDGQKHGLNPRSIYKYDMVDDLPINKRLFQVARSGIPDGIKVDRCGNVYTGCNDGIEIFTREGYYHSTLFAKGGIGNFALLEHSNFTINVFGLNENRIIKWDLS